MCDVDDDDDDDISDRAISEPNTTIRDDAGIAHALDSLSSICTVYTNRIAIHGSTRTEVRDNIRTVRAASAHISDHRLEPSASANLNYSTMWLSE